MSAGETEGLELVAEPRAAGHTYEARGHAHAFSVDGEGDGWTSWSLTPFPHRHRIDWWRCWPSPTFPGLRGLVLGRVGRALEAWTRRWRHHHELADGV